MDDGTRQELFRQYFALAPIGFGISDPDGILVDFNDAMLRYGGWSREDILRIGKVSDLYEGGEPERQRILGITRERGGLDRQEVRFKRKDGSSFWALMSLRPAIVEGKRYWLAMVEDVTDLKTALQERERYVADLERLTRMMVERELQMIEMKKRLEELERRLGKAAP
jgi:PAS domain S-box-containing protein